MESSNKNKGFISLLILLGVLVGFAYLGYTSLKVIRQKQLGLDLSGGVSITYQTTTDNPSDQDMKDTIYKLQQRVQSYSTEAQVYEEGTNRIKIDIPGVSDADTILADLGKPGSLVFKDPSGNTILTGDQVKSSEAQIGTNGTTGQKAYSVKLVFNDEGKKAFGDATTNLVGKQIAIVYDGKQYSNPVVQEAITGGECYIDNIDTYEEAEQLASTIRIGSLKVELEKVQSSVVGAQLGQRAITTSFQAAIVGFFAVALFMILVYWIQGVAASLALTLYVSLILCLIRAFNITLTLPGIAGIILSVGMAVDANVIIFTRVREEIGQGKTVRSAVKTGFYKALSAIVDGNITTLIAALVLFFLGTGTVKGFAVTLALGVLVSMFTAITITRTWLYAFCDLGWDQEKLFGRLVHKKTFDFLGKRRIFMGAAISISCAGLIALAVWGAKTGKPLNYGLDFKGGNSLTITFDRDIPLEEIDSKIKPIVANVTKDQDIQASKIQGTTQVNIKTRTLSIEESAALDNALETSEYKISPEKVTSESISGSISAEMRRSAILAVFIALFLMLIYITIRFSNVRFATAAIICLFHDVLMLCSFYVIFRWSIGSTFIACTLTLIGYSINDTIVVFDRMRENLRINPGWSREDIVNKSISETLTRSLFTSLTTFMTICILFIMGVSSIRDFTLPLMVGAICGTYSSIAIASPLWFLMERANDRKKLARQKVADEKKAAEKAAHKAEKAKNKK